MLDYKKISETTAINYLESNNYDKFWFENTSSPNFFIRPVYCYGIFDDCQLKGIFILEDWDKFFEPHIFTDKSIRGIKLLKLLSNFLKNKIGIYGPLIGRIPRSMGISTTRAIKRFSKWLGMLPFKKDSRYYYVGFNKY